ncbi:MAG: FAD-binding dehydrogenase [Candidatus Dormibacteraeota bacterium]|nr:FAD-binding dehydrogenase [Candidatus Dormibacteraeota bacterium]
MAVDVIVVGGGLAGLVATCELVGAGHTVALVDQESRANLGGQAYWSLGGIFLVDSPQQRRLGIHDSVDIAWQDYAGSAGWDRLHGPHPQDEWAVRWGRAFVEFAAGEARVWLREQGVAFAPLVGWAERGDGTATGHGNSVPRFHLAWGSGTGISEPFAGRVREAATAGLVSFFFRHRVDDLLVEGGRVVGVAGTRLAPDGAPRGRASNRRPAGLFELRAPAVVLATGGIGANHPLIRANWPRRLGTPPGTMVTGVPAYVDGRMLAIAERAGARVVNRDRMWHYTEGLENWDPIWPGHGIRVLPGPSPVWLDALGRRLPPPGYPGFDTLGTLRILRGTPELQPFDHSWFVLTHRIIRKEFALSGSEQNPDLTTRDRRLLLRRFVGRDAPGPVEAFLRHGADFVVADSLDQLVRGMNALTPEPLLEAREVRHQIEARDLEIRNPFTKDAQVMGIRNARRYLADRLTRVATPHRVLDPAAGPLIGVRLHILTRKTLGGIQTDLEGRVLRQDGVPLSGLYAAGEVAGFGGGGAQGYNALEGTFLLGCMFTGRAAGRSLVEALR